MKCVVKFECVALFCCQHFASVKPWLCWSWSWSFIISLLRYVWHILSCLCHSPAIELVSMFSAVLPIAWLILQFALTILSHRRNCTIKYCWYCAKFFWGLWCTVCNFVWMCFICSVIYVLVIDVWLNDTIFYCITLFSVLKWNHVVSCIYCSIDDFSRHWLP